MGSRGRAATIPGTLNHVRVGEGEPLVLLHGIGGELCVWEPVLEALAAHHEVIALDLPGFGDSRALPTGLVPTPATLAAAVAAELDRLGLGRVHAVGNSLGAWVALELARAGRALSVVGLCPAGLWGPRTATRGAVTRGRAHRIVRATGPLLRLALLNQGLRRVILSPFAAHPERIPYHDAWRMIHSYGRSTAYDATSTAMRRGHFQHPEQLRVPVLLAFGDHDRLIRPTQVPAPGFSSVMMPGCGHIPMWDDTELVIRLILGHTAASGSRCRS